MNAPQAKTFGRLLRGELLTERILKRTALWDTLNLKQSFSRSFKIEFYFSEK